jgi:hypothetical protein
MHASMRVEDYPRGSIGFSSRRYGYVHHVAIHIHASPCAPVQKTKEKSPYVSVRTVDGTLWRYVT